LRLYFMCDQISRVVVWFIHVWNESRSYLVLFVFGSSLSKVKSNLVDLPIYIQQRIIVWLFIQLVFHSLSLRSSLFDTGSGEWFFSGFS
jgi:hypothetical protein